jgi:hypothetical protein
MVLAIRLNGERVGVWETNLAAVLQSLTGILPTNSPSSQRWSLKKHHAPNLIEFVRAGEWTVLGAAQEHNALLDETLARIRDAHVPFAAEATNSWMEASVDLSRILAAAKIDSDFLANLPKVSLTLFGNGENVLTRGELVLPEAMPLQLGSWNIPTNLMTGDLSSFTTVRGLKFWLARSKMWNDLQIGPPPDQLITWAFDAAPMETYFAAPLPTASNTVSRLSDLVLQKGEPWFATHDLARFQRAKTFNGLEWKGAPYMSPFLKSADDTNGRFMLGGFFPLVKPAGAPPWQLIHTIEGSTNIVYYDWELTGPRIDQWTYITQFLRVVRGQSQLPADSVAMAWLKSASQKLGPSTTEIDRVGPQQFTFTRSSGFAFTAIELQLSAKWLESPEFPAPNKF